MLFLWILTLFFTQTIESSSAPGITFGYFELQVTRVQNSAGELLTGNCCDGTRNKYGCQEDKCDTYFRVCLMELQMTTTVRNTEACTFGRKESPVLGKNSFVLDNVDDPANPGRIKIPIMFTWTRTFTMILEAFDQDNFTDLSTPEERLIFQSVDSRLLNPSSEWHTYRKYGATALIEYKIRIRCNTNYFGFNCTKFCQPRSGFFGHYKCDSNGNKKCMPGWMGKDCRQPQCKLGCSAEHGTCHQPNECKCSYGWQGELCNECITYPGCEHGSCNAPWQCNCDTNWGGLLCNRNLNYCGTYNPCKNGGTCTNPAPDQFECSCLDGYAGKTCEQPLYSCASTPCQNGGVCHEHVEGFRCACEPGWTGVLCQTDFDDCWSQPCKNGGICHDELNGFQCDCPPHWEGATCQLDADECENSPCVHAKSCRNLPGEYFCVCDSGWEGINCDQNADECQTISCKNGGSCKDLINGIHCSCQPGYSGQFCQINVNECANEPCLNGGQCVDNINSFQCLCPAPYSGKRCELEVGYCSPDPCENGARCFNINGDYYCNCSSNYEGKNCTVLRRSCKGSSCEAIDSCSVHATSKSRLGYNVYSSGICGDHGTCTAFPENKYKCNCEMGYEGTHCELNVDDCKDVKCLNGGTCVDEVNGFKCLCVAGWEGLHCESEINECEPDPCHGRGQCIDVPGDFLCQCNEPWKGKTCRSTQRQCDEDTCRNGGSCEETENTFICNCTPEWTGSYCTSRVIPLCDSRPCENGGTCVGSDDSFTCICRDGFTGEQCEENIDDCAHDPCHNEGLCIDEINRYRCECLDGFTGPDCRTNIDECASTPCAFGSTCIDLVGDFHCKCPPGRQGKTCDAVVGEENSCMVNGMHYPHQARWKDLCNECICSYGVPECTKLWCGQEACGGGKFPRQRSCAHSYSCVELHQNECLTKNCRPKRLCRKEHSTNPAQELDLLGESSLCLPNTKSSPARDCAILFLLFRLSEMDAGVWVQDICVALRSLPDLRKYARDHTLVIRCAISSLNSNVVKVSMTSNSSNGDVDAAAENLYEILTLKEATSPVLDSIYEVQRKNVKKTKHTNNYVSVIIAGLAAAVGAITLVLLFFFAKKHGHCFKTIRADRRKPPAKINASKSTVKVYSAKANNHKITNHNFRDLQRTNVLDVNQLQRPNGTTTSVPVTASKREFTKTVENKNASPEENLFVDGVTLNSAEKLFHFKKGVNASSYPGRQFQKKNQTDKTINGHAVSLAVNSQLSPHPHSSAYEPFIHRVDDYPEESNCDRIVAASSYDHRSRSFPTTVCRDHDSDCDVSSDTYIANNNLPLEELSECEEVAMLMCRDEEHHALRSFPASSNRKSYANPNQTKKNSYHRRGGGGKLSSRELRAERDGLLSDSELMKEYCPRVSASPRCLTTEPPLDATLPSYESVVSSSIVRSGANNISPVCNCNLQSPSSCVSAHEAELDLTHPPPSYSRHRTQTKQLSRVPILNPSGTSLSHLDTDSFSSGKNHRSNKNFGRARNDTHSFNSSETSDVFVTSLHGDNKSSAELLSERFNVLHEVTV